MIAKTNRQRAKKVKTVLRWMASLMLFTSLHAFAQSSGTVTYVYTDPQGTPLAEADASGNITATFEYTPYGTFAPTGTSNPGPDPTGPGYTGHVNDPETNLVYMQARYYDPVTGQFLSVDPVNPVPSNTFNFNRYAYANNNPITNTDPTGKFPGDLGGDAGDEVYSAQFTGSGDSGGGNLAQKQTLSSQSNVAIEKASKKYGYDADAFESVTSYAGMKYGLDPNLLVGLASRESSLDPLKANGGLFQIQNPSAYGLSEVDIYKFQAQIPAAARKLSSNIQSFGGNVDLGIASWTLGLGGTQKLFSSGGMQSVRNAWLDRGHHDYGQVGLNYIDVIEAFAR